MGRKQIRESIKYVGQDGARILIEHQYKMVNDASPDSLSKKGYLVIGRPKDYIINRIVVYEDGEEFDNFDLPDEILPRGLISRLNEMADGMSEPSEIIDYLGEYYQDREEFDSENERPARGYESLE